MVIESINNADFSELKQLIADKGIKDFEMVALDMDGTLLTPKHELSERTIASIKKINDTGVAVVLATGRMTSAVQKHWEKLGIPGLVVSHNGALVKDLETGDVYHHQTIPDDIVAKTLKYFEDKNSIIHFNVNDCVYLTNPNLYSQRYSQELEIDLKYIPQLEEIKESPTTILLMDTKETLQRFLAKLEGEYDYVLMPWYSDIWWLQLLPANTSKGKGVIAVAERLGIAPKSIISFGDSYNDKEMLQLTGLGVAMDNAVPELKKIADFVTFSNQDDGVALALEALL